MTNLPPMVSSQGMSLVALPTRSWLRSIPTTLRGRVCSYFSGIRRGMPFTLSGAYPEARTPLPYWLLHTVPTLRGGLRISGGENEPKKTHQARA